MSSNPERQTNPDPKTIESLLNDCITSLSLPMIKKILDSERAKLFKDNPTPYLNEILKNGLKKLDKEPYLTSLKKDIIIVKLILNERKERKDRVIMTQQKLKTVIPSQLNALFKLPPKNASLEDLENYHCQITLALATYDRRTKLPSTLAENLKIVRARINALKQREKNINSFSKPIPVISTVKNSRLIESKIHIEAVAGDSLHSIFKEHFSFLFPKGYDFKNVRILKNKGNNHYEIFLGRIKPGDIVYFQYGSLIIKKSSDRESPKNFKTKPPNKIRRREEITSAIETMEENGVTFYFVKKGDTIFRIFQNLIKKDPAKFEYLRGKHEKCFKLTYMNIPTKYLPENEWVPI
ncbi:MAG: hypothetical protein OEL89_04920, partial [Candidatus Peregrinibacteria bacterium]|nr:hypothetical protein [Candidatus Peregrinibacteria bacterium]